MSVESVPDVLVVGGGVIGLSIAYFLSREGAVVTVLDQGQPGQEASWAGAGMLPPGNLAGAREPAAQLRAFSCRLWKGFSQELRELTGLDNGFQESGGMELGFVGEGPRLLAEERVWQAEGVSVEKLATSELQRFEPAISPAVEAAYRLPGFCQVRNPRHLKALTAACQTRNVRIIAGAPVTQFETVANSSGGQAIVAAVTPIDRYPAGKFVIAGGAWTGGITRQLGIDIRVRPVRGQIVLLSACPLPFRHVLTHESRYLVPRADGKILIGATEEEVGFDKQNTVEGVAGLLEFAQTVVPALARAKLERTWSGLRPGSPNGEPYLSQLPRFANGYVAAGHFRAGLQLSPATGQLMAELITTGKTSLDLDHFRVRQ